jgi:stage II sporulation protein D
MQNTMALRRILPIVALAVSLAGLGLLALDSSSAAQTPKQGPASFLVSGRGWGHGVGLSQWGAYGFARQGTSHDQILAHYYQGTTLGPAPLSRVRVLLVPGRARVTISSQAPFRVRDALGETFELAAGPHQFGPGFRLRVNGRPQHKQLTGPLTFLPGTAPLRLDRAYRGNLVVSAASGKVRVVNHVGLEAYLFGVVPGEMPFYWVPEALKAQAVAARTYALAVRKSGSDFDLYPDVRSQVYSGISGERASTTAAVQATAGQVVLYQGRIATTYFFSTSGGRTATVGDVWPGSGRIPYLVSVPDPYDSASPHHEWGPFSVQSRRLARALRVPGRLLDVRLAITPSGRVRTVTAVGSRGGSTVTGADVRRALGLRSTWFRISLLALDPPSGPVTFNTKLTLNGVARGLAAVTVEFRPLRGTWRPVGSARATRDGKVTVSVRARETGDYRLISRSARSEPVRVSVAPYVRFYALADSTTLRGYVRPILPGAAAALQRLNGATWRNVAQATVDERGDFQAQVTLTPGDYRARVTPGRGFVPGVTPVLKVGPA